jgi:rhodanese-related sulfurtransferase
MMPWWWPFGQVPEVAPKALAREMKSRRPPQLVDVRSAVEHARGHIGGVKLVPLPELRQRLGQLGLDSNRPVVAVCKTGHRSRPAVRLLRRAGFDARQLAGGMDAWRRGRHPEFQRRAS